MHPAIRIAGTILLASSVTACGATSYDAPLSFESASLNTSYRGAYQRPAVQAGRVDTDSIPSPSGDTPRPGDTGSVDEIARSTPVESSTRSRPTSRPERLPEHSVDVSSRAPLDPPSSTAEPRLERPVEIEPSGHQALDYVLAVYALNGIEFRTSQRLRVVDLYRAVQQQGTIYHSVRPVVGDLVFFHNTSDRNADGRNNDWYAHVGIVESIEPDGTVHFLHYVGDEVTRARLNLETRTPSNGADPGSNSRLRHRKSGDPEYTQYLAGDLFAGFGSVLGSRSEFFVLDEWQPGSRLPGHASLERE